jgi:hypothetical protein
MPARSLLLSSSCLVLLTGCALHTPYQVLYGTIDYNTERHLSAQVSSYDHLPLKPIRVKLMRFGYNVGPLPSGTGLGTGCHKSWKHSDGCETEPMIVGYVPPTTIVPAAPAANPAVPPAPPAQIPAASLGPDVRAAAHPVENASRAASAAWLFGAPTVR